MKQIVVVQSIPKALGLIMNVISETFPQLNNNVIYERQFERTLEVIPKDGDVVVIASNDFHDDRNVLFTELQKNGDSLAREIKKINPRAKVYIFSTYKPDWGNINGFFKKTRMGDDTVTQIVEIFRELGLDKP